MRMNTKHILYPVLLAAALLTACNDGYRLPGDEPETDVPETKPASVQFTAALPPQARTSYDRYEEGENKGFTVKWKGKTGNLGGYDEVGIIVTPKDVTNAVAGNSNLPYYPDQSGTSSSLVPADGQNQVRGLEADTEYDFYAYYPYNSESDGNNEYILGYIKNNYEKQQQSAPNNTDHLGAYDFMCAKVTGKYSETDVTNVNFAFTHCMAFVQIDVKNTRNDNGPFTVRALHLTVDQSKMTIPRSINLQRRNVVGFGSAARQTLTVKSPVRVTFGEVQSYWMAIMPEYGGKTMRVTVETEDGEYSRDLAAPTKGFVAGKNYVLQLAVTNQPDADNQGTWTPFIFISNASELAKIRNDVNNGTTYEGQTIALSADIPLNGEAWTPIGTSTNPFKGTFDGRGYTISNLNVTTDVMHAGLFGYIKGAKILNLHAHGTITHTYSTNGGGHAGGICGYADSSEISGCSFAGTVSGHGNAGGIAGSTYYTPVTACRNTATVSSTGTLGYSFYLGGIVGNARGKVTACYNTGEVKYTGSHSITKYIGGICGSADTEVTACYNTGTVTPVSAEETYFGSICGSSVKGSVAACYAKELHTQEGSGNKDYGDNPDCVTAFSATAWPSAAAHAAWTADANANGSENRYWKSLGSWSGTLDASTLPKLWWETK